MRKFHDESPDQVLKRMELIFNLVSVLSTARVYDSNIKSFAYKVGCPEAHEGFQCNIAELWKFNATQMPIFQKLQDELQAKIKENNEQREIITGLVLRHLIEHLPSNPCKNRTSATD